MKYFICFLFLTNLFSYDNLSLINDLYYNTIWKKYDINKQKQEIFISNNAEKNIEYIKIEQIVDFDKNELFTIIKNLNSYNQIVSNKKISTELIFSKNDTLYGHQLITNMIPFIRNREYVFKMYMIDENRLDWVLLNEGNVLLQDYVNRKNNILTYGAGSWEIKNDSLLTFRIFVDDEVNLPNSLIKKIRINSVVKTFNDVLKNLNRSNIK